MRLEDHAKGATMTDASRADTTPSRRHSPIRRDSPIAPSSTLFPAAALSLVIIALGGCAASTPMIGSQVSGTADHSTMVIVQDTEAEDAPDPETTTLEQADGQAKSELDAAVAAVEEAGADISYIVLNLENGQTIEHNADRAYYSASTIKAPFCISLVRAQGDAARTNYGGLITSTIVNSDNEAYRTLRERLYGQSFFGELSAQAGAPCDLTHWYCDYSVRDLTNIWRVCADWLATDDPVPNGCATCSATRSTHASTISRASTKPPHGRRRDGFRARRVTTSRSTEAWSIRRRKLRHRRRDQSRFRLQEHRERHEAARLPRQRKAVRGVGRAPRRQNVNPIMAPAKSKGTM